MTALVEIDNVGNENDEQRDDSIMVTKTESKELDSNFCGVGMEDMPLPCGMGGAAATAALPRELISRLSLLPDRSATADTKKTQNDLISSLYSDHLTCLCGPGGQISEDENDPIPSSVLSNPNRSICVVTTAALPWRTGTAVNPLLRALYLVRFQREQGGPNNRGSVALVIPWLESSEEREKLYGAANKFSDGQEGMKEQELWIKQYAKERCNMEIEANELKYIWYPSFYLASFGSIFPKVDLCNYIPSELVDVAILEEPEHLNWFRMPDKEQTSGSVSEASGEGGDDDLRQNPSTESDDESITLNHNQSLSNVDNMEQNKLGWTHRFLFVVGIVHTNYEEYARQYGIGASLIAAPAIGALSALTMRAYCHQVIKLSNTLPNFAPGKECTCNVHGVRKEFLEDGETDAETGAAADDSENETSSVYFIGKLVWAKGFDVMIELQELFRKKNGHYFDIDIYGGGPDETAITRAFHGRNHTSPSKRPPPPEESSGVNSAPTSPKDLNAAAVFANPDSLKTQSNEAIEQMKQQRPRLASDDAISQYLNVGFEISASRENITYVNEDRDQQKKSTDPLNILGDLSGRSIKTGVKTSHALYNIADSSIKEILTLSFSKMKKKIGGGEEPNFVFDPPKSRYELRRHPIPAKFPGVIDHAQLNNPKHKIFLNPSTSEVLCTTSAEALAMGKFVILPRHPSNEFFLQFTNCLAYDTLEECAEKLKFALDNDPAPLSPEERRIFTWEAATERLIESSFVSIKDARERAEGGMDVTDARIAFWLAESGKFRSLFQK